MVISRSTGPRQGDLMAASRPSSSSFSSATKRGATSQSTLHDFSFPVLKTWGSQRVLRCAKVPPENGKNAGTGGGNAPYPSDRKPAPARRPGDDGLEKIPSKLVVHLRGKVDPPGPPLEEAEEGEVDGGGGGDEDSPSAPAAAAAAPPASEMPWSLRTRRSTYARPAPIEQGHSPPIAKSPPSPPPPHPLPARALRRRSAEDGETPQPQRRLTLSVTLTRDEIEEDIYALTGRRASRRPKKRPRALKKQLDMLFPGFYLSDVTADAYEVVLPEPTPPEC